MDRIELAIKCSKKNYKLNMSDPNDIWLYKFQKRLDYWLKNNKNNSIVPQQYDFIVNLILQHKHVIKNKYQPFHDTTNKIYELISKDIYNYCEYILEHKIITYKYLDQLDNLYELNKLNKMEQKLYNHNLHDHYYNKLLNDNSSWIELYEIYNFHEFPSPSEYKNVRKLTQ